MNADEEIETILAISDPIERARRANHLATRSRERTMQIARIRQETLRELVNRGMTYQQIADELEMTPQRVHQLTTAQHKEKKLN